MSKIQDRLIAVLRVVQVASICIVLTTDYTYTDLHTVMVLNGSLLSLNISLMLLSRYIYYIIGSILAATICYFYEYSIHSYTLDNKLWLFSTEGVAKSEGITLYRHLLRLFVYKYNKR